MGASFSDRLSVLLIDDDEDDYILTRAMLSEAHGRIFVLDWARSFEAGRERLQNLAIYDAVLVDYDLGERSGLDLIREVAPREGAPPMILYTGRGSYQVDIEALEAGATLYLTKAEATPLLLERFIRYAIEARSIERALDRHARELESARAEAAAGQNLLEAVFQALPVGLAIVDEHGGVVEVNEAYNRIWRGPRPIPSSVDEYDTYQAWWIDSDAPLQPQDWASAQAIQTGSVVENQLLRIRQFDGSQAVVLNSAAPVRDADGKITACAVAIQDLTGLHQLEQALQRSRDAYLGLLAVLDEAVGLLAVIFDASGAPADYILTGVNPAFEKLFGIDRTRVLDRSLSTLPFHIPHPDLLRRAAVSSQPLYAELTLPERQKRLRLAAFSTEKGTLALVFSEIPHNDKSGL